MISFLQLAVVYGSHLAGPLVPEMKCNGNNCTEFLNTGGEPKIMIKNILASSQDKKQRSEVAKLLTNANHPCFPLKNLKKLNKSQRNAFAP